MGTRHLAAVVVDAYGAKSTLDGIRIVWIAADHTVPIDFTS
jgi:hypothetical protein